MPGRLSHAHHKGSARAGAPVDQGFEGLRLADGQLGQHFAVDVNAGGQKAADKSAVGQTVLANRCIDALDPKGAEIALSELAADIGVLHRTVDGGVGRRDIVLAAAIKAFGLLEDALPAKARGYGAG